MLLLKLHLLEKKYMNKKILYRYVPSFVLGFNGKMVKILYFFYYLLVTFVFGIALYLVFFVNLEQLIFTFAAILEPVAANSILEQIMPDSVLESIISDRVPEFTEQDQGQPEKEVSWLPFYLSASLFALIITIIGFTGGGGAAGAAGAAALAGAPGLMVGATGIAIGVAASSVTFSMASFLSNILADKSAMSLLGSIEGKADAIRDLAIKPAAVVISSAIVTQKIVNEVPQVNGAISGAIAGAVIGTLGATIGSSVVKADAVETMAVTGIAAIVGASMGAYMGPLKFLEWKTGEESYLKVLNSYQDALKAEKLYKEGLEEISEGYSALSFLRSRSFPKFVSEEFIEPTPLSVVNKLWEDTEVLEENKCITGKFRKIMFDSTKEAISSSAYCHNTSLLLKTLAINAATVTNARDKGLIYLIHNAVKLSNDMLVTTRQLSHSTTEVMNQLQEFIVNTNRKNLDILTDMIQYQLTLGEAVNTLGNVSKTMSREISVRLIERAVACGSTVYEKNPYIPATPEHVAIGSSEEGWIVTVAALESYLLAVRECGTFLKLKEVAFEPRVPFSAQSLELYKTNFPPKLTIPATRTSPPNPLTPPDPSVWTKYRNPKATTYPLGQPVSVVAIAEAALYGGIPFEDNSRILAEFRNMDLNSCIEGAFSVPINKAIVNEVVPSNMSSQAVNTTFTLVGQGPPTPEIDVFDVARGRVKDLDLRERHVIFQAGASGLTVEAIAEASMSSNVMEPKPAEVPNVSVGKNILLVVGVVVLAAATSVIRLYACGLL
jgi:hypothetical protein